MLFFRLHTLIGISGALIMLLPVEAEAQIVRRFAGGGVQVNAPFVRVNVGPRGTSVRAPFTAVDTPGRVFIGRRRRMLAQPQYAAQPQAANPVQRPRRSGQQPQRAAPQPAVGETLPYPTASQLAAMDDRALIETLRDMMSRLDQRLTLLKTGVGWQRHLVLSTEVLGELGAPPEVAQLAAMQKALPRYHSVADQPEFMKISSLPSFVAIHAALQEILSRFSAAESGQLELGNPRGTEAAPDESREILPTPDSAEIPEATRGEHSILKHQ